VVLSLRTWRTTALTLAKVRVTLLDQLRTAEQSGLAEAGMRLQSSGCVDCPRRLTAVVRRGGRRLDVTAGIDGHW